MIYQQDGTPSPYSSYVPEAFSNRLPGYFQVIARTGKDGTIAGLPRRPNFDRSRLFSMGSSEKLCVSCKDLRATQFHITTAAIMTVSSAMIERMDYRLDVHGAQR